MALSFTKLASAYNNSDASSYATASHSVTEDRPVIVFVVAVDSAEPPQPTISGHGTTWEVAADRSNGSSRRVTAFVGVPPADSTDTIDIDFGGSGQTGCGWSVIDCTDADAADAVVQAVTNSAFDSATFAVTLAAGASANNRTLGYAMLNSNSAITDGDAFTTLSTHNGSSPNNSQLAQHSTSTFETTCDWSGATGQTWIGIALEIAEAAPAAPQTIDVVKASETETAKTVSVASTISIAVAGANETETAPAVAATSTITISVGVASETETAHSVTVTAGAVTISVGVANETESAQGISVQSAVTVAVDAAAETETAQAVTMQSAVTVTVATAVETETAQAITAVPGAVSIAVGTANEVETAHQVEPVVQGGPQSIAVVVAVETETAYGITVATAITVSVGAASETESAGTIVAVPGAVSIAVGVANETETAPAVTLGQTGGFFWERDPVGWTRAPIAHTKAPVGFTRIGASDDPPWN